MCIVFLSTSASTLGFLTTEISPPHPVVEEAAGAPTAEEDMGSRSNRNPSSRALNTTDREKECVQEY